ncbi:glycosyltransferase family 2 protein [Azospirillum lipoferum]|uniref:Glycosyltransferase 2-like domain-containing protein n=1 Tax=Azospirillum lipoferum (strain 4B) TaxID=862719 RepID=G7ZJ75_AZOL4|nr:TIGR00180 family glycosyltransferase [Azospirillum lipoferum]CBS91655.1 protein of unknown function [Azospirillum lipoferum 4B]
MTPVTIIIPTMNRPDYIQRALSYYKDSGFDGCIIIGDSSKDEFAERIRGLVKYFENGNFRLRIFHYSHTVPLTGVWRALIAAVDTKYITYAGDDDLQIPSGMHAAVAFLEENPTYVAARCAMVEVSIGQEAPFGEIIEVSQKYLPDYDIDGAVHRFSTYAQMAISVQYGIYRTEAWRISYGIVPEPYLPYFGEEFIPCSISVVLGKIKSLPQLGAVQQSDGAGGVWKHRTIFDLIRAPEWPVLSRLFQAKQAELLTRIDRIVPADAERLVEQILWWHVNMLMEHHYKLKYGQPPVIPRESDSAFLISLERSSEFTLVRDVFRRKRNVPC